MRKIPTLDTYNEMSVEIFEKCKVDVKYLDSKLFGNSTVELTLEKQQFKKLIPKRC